MTQLTNTKTESNIGSRIFAGIIDYGIIYSFTFLLIFILGEQNNEGVYELTGAPVLIPILFWFVMTVLFESGLGGTVGNSLVGLKAIPISGKNRKLTFGESLKRHLLDPIDMFLFGLVGIITINSSEKNQRVGDICGRTIVVKMKDLKKAE
ncbi:RDD family protein [Aquimarina sp. RZ0]|uniref:RDD family protein n=1 Tax=Aquimarina sp. RZ0 TaxID=2607730 RepID=UPI0011F2C43C|nr:RDD family protein [Aquimarina sp. RZ0]KAA1242886.1 RDD family protein [Aquimarina sp. RZ0]